MYVSLENNQYHLISLKYLPSFVVPSTPGHAIRIPPEKQRLYVRSSAFIPLFIYNHPVEYPVNRK